MNIKVIDRQSSLIIEESCVKALVQATLDFQNCCCDEVSVFFIDTEEMCQLHQQFFNDASPTDCISFPMDRQKEEDYWILGDVFVCPEVAIDNARDLGNDPYDETALYIVHGLLHLLGYDDMTEKDRKRIRLAERENLENFKRLGCSLKYKE